MFKKVAFVSLALSSLLFAQDAADAAKSTPLKTHTKLGYISTQGNTKTESFSFDTKWEKAFGQHKFNWMFDAQYGKAEDSAGVYATNKNKFFTELGYDYAITDRLAFNYLIGYKHDKFSAYNYQFYTGPGAKYQALKMKAHNLSLEGNVLYSRDEYQDDNIPAGNDQTNDYAAIQAKGVYTWQITETLKFEETASYRADMSDFDNYFVYSDSELLAKISDIFSAGLGYKIDYVNLSGDREHTDRTLLATLSMDY